MGYWTEVEIMHHTEWSLYEIKKLAVAPVLIEEPPLERGKFGYDKHGRMENLSEEGQVPNSLARYNHPKYKELYYGVKQNVEQILGEKLYPTYYFDRFYFKGQKLERHKDRPACEVSVSMNISTNANYDWPIYFQLHTGEIKELVTKHGDAVLYKGMELEHWREPLKGDRDVYYHQIFMHYVRADGYHVEYAYDTKC